MSKPINLPKDYGKIPETPKLRKICAIDLKCLARVIKSGLIKSRLCTAGTIDLSENDIEWFTKEFKVKPQFHAIPIKDDKKSVKGWLVHDITGENGERLFHTKANFMILMHKEHEPDVFFTEYGQSFTNEAVVEKHLGYQDAKKIKDAMYKVEVSSKADSFMQGASAFSFFSRRLAELGQDKKLTRLRKLLQYCSNSALLANFTEGEDKLLTELGEILSGLIQDHKNAKKPDDKRRLILLKAIQQQIRRHLDKNLPSGSERKKPKALNGITPVLNLRFCDRWYGIDDSVQRTEEAKKYLKGRTGENAQHALTVIERYEDCLTAIYAKDAKQALQTDDLTCFEILAHKMKLAARACLNEETQKVLNVDKKIGVPRASVLFEDNPFVQIVGFYPAIYSQHLVEAKKYHADDLMYRWALQHAEEMGVPVGPYEKLDDTLYEQLDKVAKVDDPSAELKRLDEQGLLKDSSLVGQRKNQISSIEKRPTKRMPGNGANAKDKTEGEVRKGKSNVFRSQISANYLSKNFCSPRRVIALTAPQEGTCYVPDDKVLLEMAGQAYWQSGYSKNLINAVTNKKDRQKYAVKYLIYKLRLEDYDEEDTEGSLEKLKERTILGKDLAQLDRPSMAKVILAAKVCGVKIDKDSQLRLNLLLQEPHVPSLFR